jgi:hypothetical protein
MTVFSENISKYIRSHWVPSLYLSSSLLFYGHIVIIKCKRFVPSEIPNDDLSLCIVTNPSFRHRIVQPKESDWPFGPFSDGTPSVAVGKRLELATM